METSDEIFEKFVWVHFWDTFSISVALSLGAILRLSNITPGGSEAREVGRNLRQKRFDHGVHGLQTLMRNTQS